MTSALKPPTAPAATWVAYQRIVTMYRHAPGLLAAMLAAPIGMMLLFGFVFGGALSGDANAAEYRSYLTPGVLVLVAAMGLATTASTANSDLNSGLTDRFRALPLRPIAVPAGLALAETVAGCIALVVMAAVGYLAGWRIDADAGELATAVLLLVVFRFALSWIGICLGVAVRDERILQQVAPLIFGTIMFSNIFVPTESMPGALRAIAEWNPISSVVAALRTLFGSGGTIPADAAWSLQHPVLMSFLWSAVLLAITIPTALRTYTTAR